MTTVIRVAPAGRPGQPARTWRDAGPDQNARADARPWVTVTMARILWRQKPQPLAHKRCGRAHNSSVVAGYLAHRHLTAAELPVERFFMDVALARVLYAHALVTNPRLALGRMRAGARL